MTGMDDTLKLQTTSLKQQAAKMLSDQGFNCCQAVLGAFCEDLGLDLETALKLSTPFGGGMRTGEVCGAVTGALMALGLQQGQHVQGDLETKAKAYDLTARLIDNFKTQHGTILCRELIGTDGSKEECPRFICHAVGILETMFEEECQHVRT